LVYLSKCAHNLAMLWLDSKWMCQFALGFPCCQANTVCQVTRKSAHTEALFNDLLHQATITMPVWKMQLGCASIHVCTMASSPIMVFTAAKPRAKETIQHRLWPTCTPVNSISGPFQRCFNQASSSLEDASLGLVRLFSFVNTEWF